jgi:glycosyltransferase involved in cell wall biosynthesis
MADGYPRQSKIIIVAISIDVVIPSFRLNEQNLLPVLTLSAPAFVRVVYYLVVDNPGSAVPDSIRQLADDRNIFLLLNEKNEGASFTRNRGMYAGSGEWILFLDDDLTVPADLMNIYARAARDYPDETGFIGLVQLPEPTGNFSRAILASGAMDIFSIAARKSSFVWGATANFMLRRSALQGLRFSELYPKSGGGEDIDLFLRIREKNHFRNYKTLREAAVHHPWWNGGKADFKKPFRYGLGNSRLGQLNPRYAYRDFLNLPETLFVCFVLMLISLIASHRLVVPIIFFIAGILIIELIASAIQTIKRTGRFNAALILNVLALRITYESGLLWGNLSRGRFVGIGERFHDDGKQNKLYFFRTNTIRIVKWILYPVLAFFLIRRFF